MLGNQRARRRPRYGAYVCAVISALLLLLSVFLLYSRVSLTHPHGSHQLLQKTNLLSDILVSDSADDDAVFGNTISSEDKIDELDIVDEDANFRVSNEGELAEDEEQTDPVKVSGLYFDHVTGAIRRAFDDKRSIDDWSDENIAFTVGLGVGDTTVVAFGSDDVAVDEEVRRKASEVSGIEDALLLKVGKRNNPLREGWGDWFDKKGDFLKRDRMFKSNLEILNPLNNPILQDPDSVGVTVLTRGAKATQKWWMNELKKPFLPKKTLLHDSGRDDQLESQNVNLDGRNQAATLDSVNVLENSRETKSKIKRAERRMLDKNVSTKDGDVMGTTLYEGGRQSMLNKKVIDLNEVMTSNKNKSVKTDENSFHQNSAGDENLEKNTMQSSRGQNGTEIGSSKVEVKSEFTGYLYPDGKTWGYYPGLRPHLSFSDFMSEFFTKGRCKLRIFMVWNSPPWMFTIRHQRGLESLFFHHRDACVVVFSETIELDFFRDTLLKDGYKIAVAMPNLDELLKRTPARIFASVWFEWRKTKFFSIQYSELVRLAALYKCGGIYLDSDIIVLKPLPFLGNAIGMENNLAGSSLNGAVMSFRKNSPFLMECMKEFRKKYNNTRRRWRGADLLTRVAEKTSKEMDPSSKKLKFKAYPSFIFFPISSQNITRYFSAPAMEAEKAEQDALFEKILNESLTFHFWNSLTSSLIPEPESLVSRLLNRFCLRCSDIM